MEVEIKSSRLARIETDPQFTDGRQQAVVRAFRKVMNLIRQAESSRDLYAFKSLKIKKLMGKRKHQRSLWLNDQYRLVVEFTVKRGEEVIAIIEIEDYHK
ncbi:MAG: type II toxin-antitoxin system RelE/ParE family toxin [candidate division Zixibacteria bacterium]|nr:type II toxin-antitoxin system RelE/ParE family toxin [candidate division Zixibacteria bacterium]